MPSWSPKTKALPASVYDQHGVHARADGLKEFAEIGLQHQQREGELQAQAPRDDAQLDGPFVAGEEPGRGQDDHEPEQPGEAAH